VIIYMGIVLELFVMTPLNEVIWFRKYA